MDPRERTPQPPAPGKKPVDENTSPTPVDRRQTREEELEEIREITDGVRREHFWGV